MQGINDEIGTSSFSVSSNLNWTVQFVIAKMLLIEVMDLNPNGTVFTNTV